MHQVSTSILYCEGEGDHGPETRVYPVPGVAAIGFSKTRGLALPGSVIKCYIEWDGVCLYFLFLFLSVC